MAQKTAVGFFLYRPVFSPVGLSLYFRRTFMRINDFRPYGFFCFQCF
jgi:hypothetical protein